MINLKNLEYMVNEIPQSKISKLIEYLKNNDPSSISMNALEDDLGLTSSETRTIKKILNKTKDGDLLSTTISAVLKNLQSLEKIKTKLILTGNFKREGVDYTHETVHQMINRARFRITIVGYWVYDMQEFFIKLSNLQLEKKGFLKIQFILDSGSKWRPRIMKNWNKKYLPELLEVDKEQIKTLHAKIIIIDNTEILITSANLTINAMEDNIEAGVWSNDNKLIENCIEIFKDFTTRKIILPVPTKKYGGKTK